MAISTAIHGNGIEAATIASEIRPLCQAPYAKAARRSAGIRIDIRVRYLRDVYKRQRMDLGDQLVDRIGHLVEVAAAAEPNAAIAVVVDADGAQCSVCDEEYRELCEMLREALSEHDIDCLLYTSRCV